MKIAPADRRTMVKHHAARYQRVRKGEKTRILEVFVKATGYNRRYRNRRKAHYGANTGILTRHNRTERLDGWKGGWGRSSVLWNDEPTLPARELFFRKNKQNYPWKRR